MADNLVLITGDNEEEIKLQTQKYIKLLSPKDADEFSLDIIKPTEESTAVSLIAELNSSIATPSFFGKKTVILQNYPFFAKEGPKTDKSELNLEFKKLAESLSDELANQVNLIVSGSDIDSRKNLSKSFAKSGKLVTCSKPKLSDRNWQKDIRNLLLQKLQEKALQLHNSLIEYLIEIIGTDTGRLDQELEKIKVASLSKGQLTLADLQILCPGNEATILWALANAAEERNLQACYKVIDNLLSTSKNPEGEVLGLLRNLANAFQNLLHARLFMQEMKQKSNKQIDSIIKNLSADEKQRLKDNPLIKMHPFRAKMVAGKSLNYTGPELVDAIKVITETNRLAIMSTIPARTLLEQLIVKIVSPKASLR